MRPLSIIIALALFTGLGAPAATAQKPDVKALAKKHFDQGELYYQQGEFRKALAEYKTAQNHVRHPAFIFNIAQCHRQLQEWDKALFFYELYLSEAPDATNKAEVNLRIKEAKEKIAEEKRTAGAQGKVSVITQPEGASIRIDNFTGPAMAVSPAMVSVAAGQHLVQIEKEGYLKVHKTVTVATGQIAMLEVTLVPVTGGAVEPPRRDPPRQVEPPRRDEPRRVEPPRRDEPRRRAGPTGETPVGPVRKPFHKTWWFGTALGATGLFAVLGVTGGVVALANHKRYVEDGVPRDLRQAKSMALIADVMFGLAGAAAITTIVATVLYVKRGKREQPTTLVTPSCGPTGCGVWVQGRF